MNVTYYFYKIMNNWVEYIQNLTIKYNLGMKHLQDITLVAPQA